VDDISPEKKLVLQGTIARHFAESLDIYNELLRQGVAKECARFVLPLAVGTRIFMTGSVRSWIHYIDLRSANGTQKEHMDIAEECKLIFCEQFPIVAEANGYTS
jgi:thymidylate synthase (FAD)